MRGGGLLSAGRPLLAAARRVGVAPRPGNGKCLFLFCPSRAVLVSAGLGKASSSGRRAPVAWGWGEGPGKVFSRLLTWPLCPRRHSLRLSFVRLDKGSPSMVCPSPGLESFPESTLRPRPPGKLETRRVRPSLPERRRLDRNEFSLGSELVQGSSSAGRARGRSRGWGVWNQGSSPLQGSSL
jgi:hypothetical protein